ncbi:MAG: DUF3488 and transglutaminase-like domain-containing protein [Actinomycetota bacterium]
MGNEHEAARPPPSRALLLVALVWLAVIVAAAFGRVFAGSGTAARLALAAGLSVLLAGALERRHVLLATAASAAGLAVAIGIMIFPETTWYRLPTAATVRAVVRSWDAVGRIAASESAPALPLNPLVLAALTAVWAAAFSSHALAARAGSPFLAIVPQAVLLGFAGLIMGDGPRPIYVAPFLLAALMVLFADGLRRVGRWGPVAIWHGRRGSRFAAAATGRGARRLAVACLGLALFVPGILPGFHSAGLVDVRGDEYPLRVSIDPIVDIRPRLLRQPAVTLFNVRSDEGAYWRFLALDTFDGRRWISTDLAGREGVVVRTGPLRSSQASAGRPEVRRLDQEVRIDRLSQPWLPVAFDPVEVRALDETVRYDRRSSLLVSPNGTQPGFSYSVVSESVSPSSSDLDAARLADLVGASPYLRLPPGMPVEISSIAHQLTIDQPTMYRKVMAVQQYLRTFRYDEQVAAGHDVNEIVHFLTVSKAGYCEQFAGTMAVLLRAVGIPARVAVGFAPGVMRNGEWRVTTREAHAWVEVLFPEYGWLAFEPTPSRYNPRATSYALVQRSLGPSRPDSRQRDCLVSVRRGPGPALLECDPTETVGGPPGPIRPIPTALPRDAVSRLGGGVPAAAGRRWRDLAVPGAAALVVLLALAVPGSKLARRRLALARARTPRQRVLAAYRVVADRAADLGLARRSSETLWEYRTRLKERVRSLDGDLDGLARMAGQAAYSEGGVSADQARRSMAAARSATRQLTRSAGTPRRLAGWFRVDRSFLKRWAVG